MLWVGLGRCCLGRRCVRLSLVVADTHACHAYGALLYQPVVVSSALLTTDCRPGQACKWPGREAVNPLQPLRHGGCVITTRPLQACGAAESRLCWP